MIFDFFGYRNFYSILQRSEAAGHGSKTFRFFGILSTWLLVVARKFKLRANHFYECVTHVPFTVLGTVWGVVLLCVYLVTRVHTIVTLVSPFSYAAQAGVFSRSRSVIRIWIESEAVLLKPRQEDSGLSASNFMMSSLVARLCR
jgi:hypothetical protein